MACHRPGRRAGHGEKYLVHLDKARRVLRQAPLLHINDELRVELREELIAEGLF